MQSSSKFIPNFAKESGTLPELNKKNAQCKWDNEHHKCFERLIKSFLNDTLMRYYDMKANYILTDTHISGL